MCPTCSTSKVPNVMTVRVLKPDSLVCRGAGRGRAPVFDQDERVEIISSLKVVDEVFVEESLEQKRDYILEHHADVLVMGDDWTGKFDWVSDVCEVVYLPRTPSVSTTGLIEHIAKIAP